MTQPVRSPYGHVFEKQTIEAWLQQNGEKCPMTGKPLTSADLELDVEMRKEITAYHVAEQWKRTSGVEGGETKQAEEIRAFGGGGKKGGGGGGGAGEGEVGEAALDEELYLF